MAILESRVIHNIIDELPKGNCESAIRDVDAVDWVVVHQTDSKCKGDQHPFDTAAYHVGKGWCGIGYHIFITEDGKIFQTRNLKHASAHAKGYNTRSIGVTMCGDWRVQSGVKNEDLTASKQQYKALVWTLAHLQMKYPNIKEIKSHAELAPSRRSDPNLHMDTLINDVKKKRLTMLIVKWGFLALLAIFIIELGKKVLYI